MPAGRMTPRRLATGAAVTPYTVTVATITTNVAGRILEAPPMPWAARPAPNVEAVAAATMPRGAIQPTEASCAEVCPFRCRRSRPRPAS